MVTEIILQGLYATIDNYGSACRGWSAKITLQVCFISLQVSVLMLVSVSCHYKGLSCNYLALYC